MGYRHQYSPMRSEKRGFWQIITPIRLLLVMVCLFFQGVCRQIVNPYPLLHTLPLFTQGFDMYMDGRGTLCTSDMGGDFEAYAPGDLPVTEKACSQLIFLPLLTKPVAGAVSGILDAIRKVSLHSHLISG